MTWMGMEAGDESVDLLVCRFFGELRFHEGEEGLEAKVLDDTE